MFVNNGKHDILIFSRFKNINKIQKLRNKYDPISESDRTKYYYSLPFFR